MDGYDDMRCLDGGIDVLGLRYQISVWTLDEMRR